MGAALYPVGDVDGDGLTDGVAIGKASALTLTQEAETRGGMGKQPELLALTLLLAVGWPETFGPGSDLQILSAAPCADLDGDGTKEALFRATGKDGALSLLALSPKRKGEIVRRIDTGSIAMFKSHQYGYTLTVAEDLDGDDVPDFVLAHPTASFRVSLEARSSGSGNAIWTERWDCLGAVRGLCLAPFADRDGDGVRDVLVGSSDDDWHGVVMEHNSVRLLSGATGRPMWILDEEDVPELNG